ncbi:N-acetylmuramoyl-L-alanine amidase [Chachezhania sediminis]|uniref:N-acetylmuramoyl-L-alanine amidase n=1 Tax=Chachezhania sediminis TaxID=2599291 RepID=UPI0018EEDF0A|nr:N-acetylmuramoyl-L-alanine amidase [Chachezhania sediminis]
MDLRRFPSPNFNARPDGERPELVVLHYTAMDSCEAARDRLCDPQFEVSAHYLIGAEGTVWHLVDEDKRAWHAGVSNWQGRDHVNHRSIGIELDNRGTHPFSAPLMNALEDVLPGILSRWHIPPQGVVAHSDIAPTRKQDPGGRFDWRRLAQSGLAVWPDADNRADPAGFWDDLHRFGYPTDDRTATLQAFRDHFRPGVTGPVSPRDAALARDLAQRFGVDRTAATA